MPKPKARLTPTFKQAVRSSDTLSMYYQLMEATAKMVTDDLLDSSIFETWWDEVQNAIYIMRKHSAEL